MRANLHPGLTQGAATGVARPTSRARRARRRLNGPRLIALAFNIVAWVGVIVLVRWLIMGVR